MSTKGWSNVPRKSIQFNLCLVIDNNNQFHFFKTKQIIFRELLPA